MMPNHAPPAPAGGLTAAPLNALQLLERGPIQLELSRLLHEAADGHGRLVFLGGDAGIGKSALVQRFAQVVQHGARLLVGACDPLSTPRPLGPVLDMQAQLGRRYGEMLASAADKDALFRGFLAELGGSEQATVAVFEDVHWADEATLDLLRFLGRRLEGTRAVLLATYRSDEVGDRHPLRVVLGDLATQPAVQRLSLEPLSLQAVQTLCAGTALDPVRLHGQTGGNPFYVTEVIASGGTGIPATVRDAVLARAARLPEDARAALDAAAALGFRVESRLLEQVARPVSGAIDACLAGGMLRVDGDRLVFHHELAREALLDVLPPHRARVLHRAALDVLRAQAEGSVEWGRLAHHAEGAGDAEAVLDFAPRAARRATELNAHREAAAQLARALRFAEHLAPAERAEMWKMYSWACASTDRWDEAIRADYELISIWRAEGNRVQEGWSLSFLVGCLTNCGRIDEAEKASRASVEILEALPPSPELAEAYNIQAHLRILSRDLQEGIAWARKALALAEAGGYRNVETMAKARLGSAALCSGDPDGERMLSEMLDVARTSGQSWLATSLYLSLAAGLAEWGEFARAERYLADGIAYAAEHELDGLLTNLLATQAIVLLHLGRWPDAEERARRVTHRAGADSIGRIAALLALGRLLTRRGDAEAVAALDQALALALPTGSLHRLAPVRAARAEAAWLAGNLPRVGDEARAALDLALAKRLPWFAGELLFWLAHAGEPVEAPDWIAAPFALQIEGRWNEAAAEWQRRGSPYEAAQALAETGEPDNLRAALAEFERLGAAPAAERTLRRLREQGVRGIPRGPRASTRGNPAQLTRREVEVIHLVAEGLSDAEIAKRLFISPKTVGHHVSAVLAKLGVQSRTEAMREAMRLGLVQDREPGVQR